MANHYKNKLAFITGASQGIGHAVAQQLVQAGAHVVITSRSEKKLKLAFNHLEQSRQNSHQIILYKAFDLTDYEATRLQFTDLIDHLGVPDFLINCAGYAKPGFIQDLTIKDFSGMMDLNLMGMVNACHALVPFLIKAQKGHIINTSSIAGFIGLFGYTAYCASKFAVIGFSEALNRELKPHGIKISVLCPPNTRTPGLTKENQIKPLEVLRAEEKIKTVEPDLVARKLLKDLSKKKFLIIPTLDGKLTHLVQRYFPWVIDRVLKRERRWLKRKVS